MMPSTSSLMYLVAVVLAVWASLYATFAAS